jgi:hypothetical protein
VALVADLAITARLNAFPAVVHRTIFCVHACINVFRIADEIERRK